MEYGPAPEDPKEAEAWLERHGRRFGLFIGGAWQAARGRRIFRHARSLEWREAGCGRSRRCCRHRRCRSCCARRFSEVAGAHSACPRALSLRARAAGAKTFPAARGSRNHGQRQAHPREPRHRYSAGGAAFLLSRRLGAIARARISRIRTLRRRGSDHSRGIFRCSCWRGRLRRRWRRETRWS